MLLVLLLHLLSRYPLPLPTPAPLCVGGVAGARALWCSDLNPFDKSKGPINNDDTDVGISWFI